MGNYEQFDQLMLADNGGLTVEQQQFKDLHERICYNAKKSAEHWVEMASGIREMRDSKRYKAAGFDDFADYTVNALRIKERQAYNYISVIEKLPEAFIRAHATIGVTKLALLTSVSEEERKEILETIDIDATSTTAADINAAVKAAIEERDKAKQQLALALEEKAAIEQKKRALDEENEKLEAELTSAKKASEPEVVFQPDLKTVSDLEAERKKTTKLEKESKKKDARISELENELKAKTEKSEQEKKEAVAAAEKQLKTMAAELEEAKAKKTTITDDSLLTFKVKFGDLQRVGNEIATILNGADEQTAEKLRNAMRAVITKWQEDMRL